MLCAERCAERYAKCVALVGAGLGASPRCARCRWRRGVWYSATEVLKHKSAPSSRWRRCKSPQCQKELLRFAPGPPAESITFVMFRNLCAGALDRADHPGNRSRTRPSGSRCGASARRDVAADRARTETVHADCLRLAKARASGSGSGSCPRECALTQTVLRTVCAWRRPGLPALTEQHGQRAPAWLNRVRSAVT